MEEKTALLIIDIQNDYFKDGAMELVGAEEAAENAALLISDFRKENQTIVFVQHISGEQSLFFKPDTFGVEINSRVSPIEGEVVFQKNYPNSFRETELLSYLNSQNIKKLILCGMMMHMCVDTTVRAAFDLGFENILLGDACATRNLEFNGMVVNSEEVQLSYLAAINETFAEVISTKEYLKK